MIIEITNEEEFCSELSSLITQMVFSKSQENIINNESVDEGTLLKSGSFKIIGREGLINYNAPQSVPVELGSNPHPVSPSVLEGWVRRKLAVQDPKEAKRISFAIANTIKKVGVAPKPFMLPALLSVKESVER